MKNRVLLATVLYAVLIGACYTGIAICCRVIAQETTKAESDGDVRISESQIVLRSPDGRFRLTLQATNDAAGIWIEDRRTQKTLASVMGPNESSRFVAFRDGEKLPKFALTEDGLLDQRPVGKQK